MAGNGREWTRTIASKDPDEDDDVLPFPAHARSKTEVWLLSQDYDAPEPPLFSEAADKVPCGASPPFYVGFRIVIEVPGR